MEEQQVNESEATEVAVEVSQGEVESVATEAAKEPNVTFEQYLSVLSEEDRGLLEKNGVDSFEKQVKWINGLNSLVGKKGLVKPADDASDEDKAKYKESLLNELGRPENGEYNFEVPETVPDEYVSDEFLNGLAKIGYENGMSTEAFQSMIDYIYDAYGETVNAIEDIKKQIEEQAKEGNLDDAGSQGDNSAESVRERAKSLAIEANQEHKKGNFAQAKKLQAESADLYARLASL